MESFYGGRRGESFDLVKTFKTVDDMISAFKQGGSYTDVNYGEYVIIDTDSKSDPDNGKLYRRGMDYVNDLGGAEYKGQICGTQGETPKIKVVQLDEIQNYLDDVKTEGGYYEGETLGNQVWETFPGKYIDEEGKEQFFDNIEYAYYTIQDKNYNVIGCYIGFKIPRPVIDLEVEQVNSHTPASIENLDQSHNFYDKWHICIPNGVHGTDFNRLERNISMGNSLISYKQDYTNSEEGEESSQWVGDIKDIQDIVFDDSTSQLRIIYRSFYRNDEGFLTDKGGNILVDSGGKPLPKESMEGIQIEENIPSPIKFIIDAYIEEQTKKLVLVYSTYEDEGDGTKDGHTIQRLGEPIKYIKNIEIDEETKRIRLTYNTYVDEDVTKGNISELIGEPIRYVIDQYINTENQKLHVVYNSPKEKRENGKVLFDEDGNVIYETDSEGNLIKEEDIGDPIKYVDHFDFSEDNKILVYFNTNPEQPIPVSPSIKWLKEIKLDEITRKLHVTYNTGEEEDISESIQNIRELKINDFSQLQVNYSLKSDGTPNSDNDWITLGEVKGNGLQIYDYLNSSDPETDLNAKYPTGLPEGKEGWVVAVNTSTIEDGVEKTGTSYFLFNKNLTTPKWQMVATSDTSVKDIVFQSNEPSSSKLSKDGIWGILEKRTVYNI